MIGTEAEMLSDLRKATRVLLIEPNYPRAYPPLGLAKISTYVKKHGGEVAFTRGLLSGDWDVICITTFTTYEAREVWRSINQSRMAYPKAKIWVGGIMASLMPKACDVRGVKVFMGVSDTLDRQIQDMTIDYGIKDKRRSADKYSLFFTSRGCPNKCPYCAVPKIEPEMKLIPNWRVQFDARKPWICIMDNNITGTPLEHQEELIDFIAKYKKATVLQSGIDCKHVTKEYAELYGRITYTNTGMRMSFDRIEEDGIFQIAVQRLLDAGIPGNEIRPYVLINFRDTPQQAQYRMKECLRLTTRPYAQQYVPLMKTSRKPTHIGKYWTKRLLVTFRSYWQRADLYHQITFEEYAETKRTPRTKLTNADWEAWHYRKGKGKW